MSFTSELGARGEKAAVDFLRAEGYLIMDTNWRAGRYELDIVAEKEGTVHFVEVKYRKAHGLTLPEDAMTAAKGRSLLKAANQYIASHGIESDCCVDLVAIDALQDGTMNIRLIPDALNIRW